MFLQLPIQIMSVLRESVLLSLSIDTQTGNMTTTSAIISLAGILICLRLTSKAWILLCRIIPFYFSTQHDCELTSVDNETLQQYENTGFLQLQIWMDNLILQDATGQTSSSIGAAVASVTVPAYSNDPIADNIQGALVYFMAYPLLFPYLRMSNNLILEKEKRIKEGMKMMGLSTSAFYLSWIITYVITYLVISLLYILIVNGLVFKHSSFGIVWIWYYFFCLSLISVSMLVSVFFSKAKTGMIAALVFFLALQLIQYSITSEGLSQQTYNAASLSPLVTVTLGGQQWLTFEVINSLSSVI